jgi:hypothetical protein
MKGSWMTIINFIKIQHTIAIVTFYSFDLYSSFVYVEINSWVLVRENYERKWSGSIGLISSTTKEKGQMFRLMNDNKENSELYF